jgi:hypothetical protein
MDNVFMDKLKDCFDRGVEISRKALEKADNAVQQFGEQSVLRLDINSLRSKKEKQFAKLGEFVYADFTEKNMTQVNREDNDIVSAMVEVEDIEKEIEKREKKLKKLEEKSESKTQSQKK